MATTALFMERDDNTVNSANFKFLRPRLTGLVFVQDSKDLPPARTAILLATHQDLFLVASQIDVRMSSMSTIPAFVGCSHSPPLCNGSQSFPSSESLHTLRRNHDVPKDSPRSCGRWRLRLRPPARCLCRSPGCCRHIALYGVR